MKRITFLLLNLLTIGFLSAQGDDCTTGVTTLTIDNCASFTNSEDTGGGSEPSTQTCSNTLAQHSDIWYKFTGNGQTLNLSYFADQDIAVGVYQTTCPTVVNFHTASIACQETAANTEGLLTFTTVNATTYFVRIQRKGASAATTTDQSGSICLYTNAGLAGKTCGQAELKTVGAYCSTSPWVNNDDNTIVTNLLNPCGGTTAYQDIWYRVVGTGNPIGVNVFDVTGANLTMSVYQGSCPSYNNQNAVDIQCVSTGTGATGLGGVNFNSVNGTNYYVSLRRSSGGATTNQNGSICIYDYAVGSCGNNLGLLNDNCNNPAQIQKTPGSDLNGTTGGVFTPDMGNGGGTGVGSPGAFVAPCFIIHNNSWFEFTATGTTETFLVSSSTCINVQAMVFQAINNASGCCSTFVTKSACYGPTGTAIAGATITANSLISGNKYLLMIDGYNGADCSFTIRDWGAPAGEALAVTFNKFSALGLNDRNVLSWETATESNNSHFEAQRSFDGENFETLGTVQGNGTTSEKSNYFFEDSDIRFGTSYYRLNQVDYDGKSTYSKIIALDRNQAKDGLLAIYPNPTNNLTTIEFSTSSPTGAKIELFSANGYKIHEQEVDGLGIHQLNIDLSDFPSGLYLVSYQDQKISMVERLTKN